MLAEAFSWWLARMTELVPAWLKRRGEGWTNALIVAAGETPFAHASLWAFGEGLLPYLEGLGGPPYGLAEAYQRAIDDGREVSAFEVGRTRDLTDPLDLVKENFSYLS